MVIVRCWRGRNSFRKDNHLLVALKAVRRRKTAPISRCGSMMLGSEADSALQIKHAFHGESLQEHAFSCPVNEYADNYCGKNSNNRCYHQNLVLWRTSLFFIAAGEYLI
jgi:hypothetical protein